MDFKARSPHTPCYWERNDMPVTWGSASPNNNLVGLGGGGGTGACRLLFRVSAEVFQVIAFTNQEILSMPVSIKDAGVSPPQQLPAWWYLLELGSELHLNLSPIILK